MGSHASHPLRGPAVPPPPRSAPRRRGPLHLDLLAEELAAGGMPPRLAREEARRRFGGVDQMKMRYRDQRGWPIVDAIRQDVAYGLRLFARDRSLSLAIVSALAMGIGATVTVFTILNAMLLRDVPYFREPDRVMAIDSMDGRGRQTGVSFDDYLDWRRASSFSGMSAYARSSAIVADGDWPAVQARLDWYGRWPTLVARRPAFS